MEAVVAVYADWGIGRGGTQPVTLSADRRHFRDLTRGAAVIVGRKTLADFPGGRPLPGRYNIVLTRRAPEIPGAVTASDPAAALRLARERGGPCFVIGGESVYRALLPAVDRVHVTWLSACPVSDSFFPNLDEDPAWRLVSQSPPAEENGVMYRFRVYERIS